jgi:hypothetical protein
MPDGKQVTVMILDSTDLVSMLPQAYGLGSFSGGNVAVPLLFWVLDGTWLAVAIIDMDNSGMTGITLGDMMGAKVVTIAGATVTFIPPAASMGPDDFSTINVLAHIQLSGQDGKKVYLVVYPYPQAVPCSGVPVTMGLPLSLSNGTATLPLAATLPDGDYAACVLVDVDDSGGPTLGDLSAYHPFTVSGNTEFTVTQDEFH